jgi:hypothetical protein
VASRMADGVSCAKSQVECAFTSGVWLKSSYSRDYPTQVAPGKLCAPAAAICGSTIKIDMKKYKSSSETPNQKRVPLFTLALMTAGLLSQVTAKAQVQSAGDLFVNMDATSGTEGPLNSIQNKGTLGGVFAALGGGDTVPKIATVGGTKAIVFDGNDYLQLADGVGGSLISPPAGLVGEDPTRSIEVWALNPDVAGEEAMVSWGHRGGPDGSNISFGYGSDFRWGAVGHWGGDGPDLGWSNDGGNPAPNKWHHLVYTLDPNPATGLTTSRVYVDGALANGEILAAGLINTHPDTSINIATQLEPDGTTPTPTLRLSGAIARVRIHDGVLTPEQILANYNAEKAPLSIRRRLSRRRLPRRGWWADRHTDIHLAIRQARARMGQNSKIQLARHTELFAGQGRNSPARV